MQMRDAAPRVTALLGTALISILAACQSTSPTTYTLTGTITLTSDCNKPTSPLPVTIFATLADAAGKRYAIANFARVKLVGTPPGPLTASYTITVGWVDSFPPPTQWTYFDIFDNAGLPPCQRIGCPVAGQKCSNISQWHRSAPVTAPPGSTTEDFTILCACGS